MPKPAAMFIVGALCVAVSSGLAAAEAQPPSTQPVRTGKERLSSKATDEQRVDNCKVPLEARGSKPRPGCRHATPSQ